MKSAVIFRIILTVSDRLGLRVAGLIFALVCLAHLPRIAAQVEIQIGGRVIPMWPSVVGAIVAAALSVWLWRISSRGPQA